MWTRNTGVNPYSSTISVLGFFYVHYCNNLGHRTYGLMSHPKDAAITVKCLAQGHQRRDQPGRDSHPHSGNTRTWVRCTRPLGHDIPVTKKQTGITQSWYNIGYVGKSDSRILPTLLESKYTVNNQPVKVLANIVLAWGRSELTHRNVELYPQFFLELITTQLRFYMVSPQLSLLIILTMQSYKFYLILYFD